MILKTATGRAASKPDLTFVILIHQSLRADAARLAATIAALSPYDRTGRVPGIQAFFGHYREQLAMHHRHEDELFFPALAARVGADKMHLGELASQHDALDAAFQAVSDGLAALAEPAGDFGTDHAAAASALTAMSRLLDAHLTLEEQTALHLYESESRGSSRMPLPASGRSYSSPPPPCPLSTGSASGTTAVSTKRSSAPPGSPSWLDGHAQHRVTCTHSQAAASSARPGPAISPPAFPAANQMPSRPQQ